MMATRKVFVVSHNLCAYPFLSAYSEPIKHSAVLRLVNRHENFGRYSHAYFYDVKGDRRYVMKASWESIHSHTINYEDWERYNAKP